jgi:hypothetical protein
MNEQYEEYVEDEGLGNSYQEMMKLFDELSFREKCRKVAKGLKAPKDSGEYKYAKLQLLRLSAPASAVVVPILALLVLIVLAAAAPPPAPEVEVQIIEPEEPPELEEIEEVIEEPPEPPEPVEMEVPNVEVTVDNPVPSPPSDFSPQPAPMDSVAMVKSPVVMKGMFGSRNPGSRGNAVRRYGGSGATEKAVLRALRWLKKYQNSDGSWNSGAGGGQSIRNRWRSKPAFTALALLTFLAHGETPASEEFGPTVEYAIKYLVDSQRPDGGFEPRDGHDYTHPIVTYALCEAYGLTKVPKLKDAAQKATKKLLAGQHEDGAFDYELKITNRKDVSLTGWCLQALKAAKMANLGLEGIDEAHKKGIEFCKASLYENGMAAYTMNGSRKNRKSTNGGLTGVNVLCLQLLGAGNSSEAKQGLVWLAENATISWEEPWEVRPLYYWYYVTQAKFHAGGSTWDEWNKMFAGTTVNNQVVIEDAIEGPDGKMKDIGYWESPGSKEDYGRPYCTSLCALQLQVYYRYLPTFKSPEQIEEETEIAGEDDVQVEIDV